MDSTSKKLVTHVGQLIENKNKKFHDCGEIYSLLDEGVLVLDTSLKLSTFRYISRHCEIHSPTKQIQEPIMLSSYFVPKTKNKIVKNFLWFICFNSIRHASVTESKIVNGTANVEAAYLQTVEAAKCAQLVASIILEQLYSRKNVLIPLEMVTEPGLNCERLLNYLSSNYSKGLEPDQGQMLPIYQLFYLFNLDSKYWGSLVWSTLHLMAESFALNPNREAFVRWRDFLQFNLSKYLPCIYCAQHWSYLMISADNPFKGCAPKQLPRVMHTLHNLVSKNINERQMEWEEYRTRVQPEIITLLVNKE
jgi:hypothetical protein